MDQVNRVVAIGSPHGDDQAGWRIAERFRDRGNVNAGVVALSDASQLLESIDKCDRLIVVDACCGSGKPGTVTRLEWPDERIVERHSHSTHGIGVADVLQLAESLDRLPREVLIFGIELSQCQPGLPLSDVVECALSELEEKILLEIR